MCSICGNPREAHGDGASMFDGAYVVTTGTLPLNGDIRVDLLTSGTKWASNALTYSTWDYYGRSGWGVDDAAVDAALASWSAVANISFTRVRPSGTWFNNSSDMSFLKTRNDLDLLFGGGDVLGMAVFPDAAYGNETLAEFSGVFGRAISRADYPHPEGDVFFDDWSSGQWATWEGGSGFTTLLHEIGHAIGLKHPFASMGGRPSAQSVNLSALDNGYVTVMSYGVTSDYASWGNQSSPMPLDILAVQSLYGANMNYRTGNDTYRFAWAEVNTIWDVGGIDTFDASAEWNGVWLDLREGAYNLSDDVTTTAIAYGVTIENAKGSAYADRIVGNGVGNTLSGGSGSDTVRGLDGNDLMFGNRGADQLFGNMGNDTLYGGLDADTLYGGVGDDILFGDDGSDRLFGDTGNDLMWGGDGADRFALRAGGGADLVFSFNGSSGDRVEVLSGAQYSVFTAGADAVVTLSDGSRITMVGGGDSFQTAWVVAV